MTGSPVDSRRRPVVVRSGTPSAPLASPPRSPNEGQDDRRGVDPEAPSDDVPARAPVVRALLPRILGVFAFGLVMSPYAGFKVAMATSTVFAAAVALWTVIFPPRPWWAGVDDARRAGGWYATGDTGGGGDWGGDGGAGGGDSGGGGGDGGGGDGGGG